jgi:hypothetical protein
VSVRASCQRKNRPSRLAIELGRLCFGVHQRIIFRVVFCHFATAPAWWREDEPHATCLCPLEIRHPDRIPTERDENGQCAGATDSRMSFLQSRGVLSREPGIRAYNATAGCGSTIRPVSPKPGHFGWITNNILKLRPQKSHDHCAPNNYAANPPGALFLRHRDD